MNMSKASLVQVGFDMEEAARIAGAGWTRTYLKIWLPLLMPTLVLLGTMNFVIAANTTASIILLASRSTTTLSIMILHLASADLGEREQASVVSVALLLTTLAVAFTARHFGLRLGVRHE